MRSTSSILLLRKRQECLRPSRNYRWVLTTRASGVTNGVDGLETGVFLYAPTCRDVCTGDAWRRQHLRRMQCVSTEKRKAPLGVDGLETGVFPYSPTCGDVCTGDAWRRQHLRRMQCVSTVWSVEDG